MTENNKQKMVKVISIISATVLFFLFVILVFQFVSINNLRSKENALQTKLNDLQKQVIFYENENAYMQTDEFVEDYARMNLGYGKPGETRFR